MVFAKESQEIPDSTGSTLRGAYIVNPNALKVMVNGQEEVLKGLRFEKEDIVNLFRPGVTHLFLMFAMSPVNPAYMTIIAGGVLDPNNDGGVLDKTLQYDYCEPCPNKCPLNL